MSAFLFFDIDGTLITLDKKHIMPDSAKRALKAAKANGHKIIINTGRVKTAIDKQLLEFGFDGLCCGCGTYIEYDGKELLHRTMSKMQCAEYAEKLHKYGFETLYEGNDRLFIDGDHGPGTFMNYIYEYFSENSDYPIEGIDHPEFVFDKFTTSGREDSNKDAFIEQFSRDFELIPHGPKVIEAVPIGYSKATAIKFFMDALDVSMNDCYAFGDSVNDMAMLKYVDHSIGMGNAVSEILDIVEYKTEDIEDGGIEKALRHYKLIDN